MVQRNRVEHAWSPNLDWFNDRSGKWLRRADEVRTIADNMRSLEMRQVLERIAICYEQLADLVAKKKDLALVRRTNVSHRPPDDSSAA